MSVRSECGRQADSSVERPQAQVLGGEGADDAEQVVDGVEVQRLLVVLGRVPDPREWDRDQVHHRHACKTEMICPAVKGEKGV